MNTLLPQLERAFASGGETGALIHALDWSGTPLGPIAGWPSSLQVTVSVCLGTRFPMVIQWGPDLTQIYNDAAREVFGQKHPAAMGRPARTNFPEFWERTMVDQLIEHIQRTGQPFRAEDQRLPIERRGFREETYFTFALSPLLDDAGAIRGLLNTYIETTSRVLGERRLATLRALAEQTSHAGTVEDVCRGAMAALANNPLDLRFVLLYLRDADDAAATLHGANFIPAGTPASPAGVPLGDEAAPAGFAWPIARVLRSGESVVEEGLADRLELRAAFQRRGPPGRAMVLPLVPSGARRAAGALVVGLSPRLVHDDAYLGFLDLVARQVASGIAGAWAHQEATERAEKLAELDRAKSVFYSNISHEFRTPLTLLLAPVEDLLGGDAGSLPPAAREVLEAVRRNAVRLLKLVNGLLDFARIEAGRMEPVVEPTDVSKLTRELAEAFELPMRQAGLSLSIECPPLPRPVLVDPEMWEKVVSNLLSNAMKYSREGQIQVSLRTIDGQVRLVVRDSGIGIAPDDLPHVFERFYRVKGARGRSVEGAGIGLALVHELVELHGGTTTATSALGQGTTITVEIPFETPRAARASAAPVVEHAPTPTAPWVEEARSWIADTAGMPPLVGHTGAEAVARGQPRILVAEDNPDMRQYLVKLLAADYDVEAVADGEAALASVLARPPDLIVTDVLMPGVDGQALLRAIRAHPGTRSLPVVQLSAQAGEESVLEGLGGGSDDYVRKPFSARELLARVRTHLELVRMRREAAESQMKDVFLAIASHELRTPLTPMKLIIENLRRHADPRSQLATRMATLDRSVTRLEVVVNDLLCASTIKWGQLTLQQHPADLVAICQAAAEEAGLLTKLPIVLDVPAEPLQAVVDEARVLQVVTNLLTNARKYSPPDRPVGLALRRSGDEAHLEVRDQGPGIPRAEMAHLFDRFHRVQGINVQSGSQIGLGLGLYICKAIIEQHHGRIWVESEEGRGATFHVVLPLRPPSAASPAAAVAPWKSRGA